MNTVLAITTALPTDVTPFTQNLKQPQLKEQSRPAHRPRTFGKLSRPTSKPLSSSWSRDTREGSPTSLPSYLTAMGTFSTTITALATSLRLPAAEAGRGHPHGCWTLLHGTSLAALKVEQGQEGRTRFSQSVLRGRSRTQPSLHGTSLIGILAPVRRKKDAEAEKDIRTQNQAVLVGFRSAYVFDVSQTEGKELPALSERVTGNVGEYRERLIDFIIRPRHPA